MLGKKVSHYRIIRQIGTGGMGTVYEAEDTVLNRRVAIKTLKETGIQKNRLLREAQAVSRINHPQIATIYDFGETEEGHPFIVMELVAGETLDVFLKNNHLNLPQIIQLIIDIAEAVSAAHSQGIIHRDLKPSNIIIQKNGKGVKVIDFGLSKQIFVDNTSAALTKSFTDDEFIATVTRDGIILGTPLYLSPEQATGGEINEQTDVFSLGILLYECLSGKSPFNAGSVIEICANVIKSNPPPPSQLNPQIPRKIDDITLKALSKNQLHRYRTVDQFIEDLQSAQNILPSDPEGITQAFIFEKTKETLSFRQSFRDVLQYRYSYGGIFLAMLLAGSVSFFLWKYFKQDYQPLSGAMVWYQKGVEAFNNEAFFAASKSFQRAAELDPNFAMAYAKKAESLAELGYITEAHETREHGHYIIKNSHLTLSTKDSLLLQAIDETLDSDFDSAVKTYASLTGYGNNEEKAQAFLDLGRSNEKNEDINKAIENYQKVAEYNFDLPSAKLRLGILFGREQNFEQAFSHFDDAEKIYNIQNNSEGEIEVDYQRGIILSSRGDSTKALDAINQALQKAKINDIPYQQVKCLLLLSRLLRSSSRIDEAVPAVNQAILISRQNEINNLETQSLLELGTVYLFQNKFLQSEEFYQQALRLARQYNASVIEKRTLMQLGALKVYTHKADEALDYVNQVYKFFDEGKYQKEMLDLLSIKAQAVTFKGDFDEALKIYQELLIRSEKAGDKIQKARTQKSIGTILAGEDQLSAALAPLYESYSIYNSINRPFEAGFSLTVYADDLWQLGRYKEAEAALNQISGLAEKHPQLKSRIDLTLARMYLSQNRFEDATMLLQKIIERDKSGKSDVAVEAQVSLTAAQIQSRQKIAEIPLSVFDSEDKAVVAGAYLVAAEALQKKNMPAEALEKATKAQQLFSELKKTSLEWKAWLLICQAQKKLQNFSEANRAAFQTSSLFSTLAQKLTEADFKSYSERPDVKAGQKILLNSSADSR